VPPDDARAPAEDRPVIRMSATSAVAGVGIVVLALIGQRIFVAAHRPLSWAAAAAVVAVLIDPIVGLLGRRISRPLAVLLTLLVVGGTALGIVYRAVDEINNGLDRMGEAAQEAAEDLSAREDNIGDLARDVDAERRVDDFVEALEDRATGGEEVLASTAGTAPTYLIGAIFTIFFLSYGPRVAASAAAQVRGEARRERIRRITLRALVRARRAVLFALAEGFVAGVAVGLAAGALGIPAPAALGLFAGVMTLLPHVGLVLGSLPFLLLMLSTHSDSATLVVTLIIVLCQLVDSTRIRPLLADRSVHIGLLVPWAVALVAYAVYGAGGAAYGLAFAVFVLALIDERERADESAAEAAAEEPAVVPSAEAEVAATDAGAAATEAEVAATEADLAEASPADVPATAADVPGTEATEADVAAPVAERAGERAGTELPAGERAGAELPAGERAGAEPRAEAGRDGVGAEDEAAPAPRTP
jgi:predicted PurR-regulated permease PerM